MFILLCVTLTLSTLAAALYFLLKYHYTYWQRHGFPCDPNTKIPYGCLECVMKLKTPLGMAIHEIYQQSKQDYLGIYLLHRPALLIRDWELARRILVQDFQYFHDRGVYEDEVNNPFSSNLFSQRGEHWRMMRSKLTPTFSSGKSKAMFSTADDIGNKMVAYLQSYVADGDNCKEIDLREVTTRNYAIDMIGSVIFGLDINSFEHPKNNFRTIINKSRTKTCITILFGIVHFLFPAFAKFFNKLGMKNEMAIELYKIVKDTVEYREQHNIVRKDVLQLLMQLRNTGKITEDDNNWNVHSKGTAKVDAISLEAIAAQGFIFYQAGQETIASSSSLTIYELSQYADLLAKAQNEVYHVLQKYANILSYETLKEMEFLELCILETIRKYTGLHMINRECTQNYQIPGTERIIEKGTPIIISLYGLQHDSDYFPEPEKYDPERFLATNSNYNSNAFMPFGAGPRFCIGQRMGKIYSKLAVVKILQNFNIDLMEKQKEIEFDNHPLVIIPKGGIKVKLSKKK